MVMDSSACSALEEFRSITNRMGATRGTHVRTPSYGDIESPARTLKVHHVQGSVGLQGRQVMHQFQQALKI